MFTFSIITPTLGTDHLRDLLKSLNEQEGLGTDFQIEHWIIIDHAPLHKTCTYTILNEVHALPYILRHTLEVPISTGEGGFKGHRIYAALAQWVQGDYTCLLDEDNWYQVQHLSHFYKILQRRAQVAPEWLYSFRKIYSHNGHAICDDMCESLGHFHPVYYNPNSHLIDTNCYCIQTTLFQKIAWIWNRPAHYNDQDPDRVFGTYLMTHHPHFATTQKCSLHYRLHPEGSKGGVTKELFLEGNQWMRQRFGDEGIWKRPFFYLIHFDPIHTQQLLQRIYSSLPNEPLPSIGFEQWQLNLMDGMRASHCILNGYTSQYIPSNSIVWHHMCFPQELSPTLLKRKDLYKVLYTIESPNIRHQPQWDVNFLTQNFDLCVTYWKDLIQLRCEEGDVIYYPFLHRCSDVVRELNLGSQITPFGVMGAMNSSGVNLSSRLITEGVTELPNHKSKDPSACILLENRPLQETYQINGTTLHAQDYLRSQVVREIAKVMKVFCYGKSWQPLKSLPNIDVIETPSRFLNADKTIDYYGKHLFSIVLENCDATGYVSEKLYDAWMVGSIPIYLGNIDENLRRVMGDIPLERMMISLSSIGIDQIASYLSEIYLDEIETFQKTILEYRSVVLEKVGIMNYNRFIHNTLQTIQQQI